MGHYKREVGCTDIIDAPVVSAEGDLLGSVENIVIGTADGRIRHLTVSLERARQSSPNLVDVDWSQFRVPGSGSRLELDLSPTALKVAAERQQRQS